MVTRALIKTAPVIPTLARPYGAGVVPTTVADPATGQAVVDPSVISDQRAYGNLLLGQSTSEPVTNWAQGLGNMTKALVGGYAGRRADEAEQAAKQAEIDKAAAVSSEYGDAMAAYLTGNHDTSGLVNILHDPNAPLELKGTVSSLLGEALKPQAPIKGSPGDVFFDPTSHQPLMSVPAKPPDPPTVYQEWQLAAAQGDKRDFPTFYNDRLTKMRPVLSPDEQAAAAEGIASATARGKSKADALSNLPTFEVAASGAIDHIEAIRNDPRLKLSVGGPLGANAWSTRIPGGPLYGFRKEVLQSANEAFIAIYQSALKGGGSITEIEGEKGTEAINRMDQATTEKDFRSALDDFETWVRRQYAAERKKAGLDPADVPRLPRVTSPEPTPTVAAPVPPKTLNPSAPKADPLGIR